MIRVLIVDDQDFKINDISSIFDTSKVEVSISMTLYDAKKKVKKNDFDFIVLDMAISDNLSTNTVGGLDFLSFMQSFDINIPVILVTQYYYIEKTPEQSQDVFDYYEINKNFNISNHIVLETNCDISTLPDMHNYLSKFFNFYYGCDLYDQSSDYWKKNLKEIIIKLGGEKFEGTIIR